jgi:hypothetical protein
MSTHTDGIALEEQHPALTLKADGGFLVPRPSSIAYRALCVASAPVVVVPPEPLVP